jgi:aminopeptidase-like protein
MNIGEIIYKHVVELFPLPRSITGQGVRDTLFYIKKFLPSLNIESVPSGTKAFDWTVPPEWNVHEAWIKNSRGEKIIDFKVHNLHLVGYSEPVDTKINLTKLKQHLYSLPDQPTAIPYITSYYQRRWGFCLTHEQLLSLPEDEYHVYINSTLEDGVLNYGELILKGQTDEEILLSTYICHPSMANNELSGPCVLLEIARWLFSLKGNHRYTYRILFLVETIGSIVYLSKHLEHLQSKCKAGFVLSCIGDDKNYSIIHSPEENTLADRVLEHVLKHTGKYIKYPFIERGSDERQYCAPLVNLPVVGFSRTKYVKYPEYHTSLDNLDFISKAGLEESFNTIQKTLLLLEKNYYYKTTVICEPQLGKRGMYPSLSTKESNKTVYNLQNFIAYANGKRDLIEIAEKTNTNAFLFFEIITSLLNVNCIKVNK